MRPAHRPPRPAPEGSLVAAPNVRALVCRLLTRVQAGARLAPLLTATFARRPLSPADRAWATEVGNGVLRHQQALDQALAAHLARPVAALPPPVRVALRMAAYQLLHMRVPAHAAVDTGVSLIGRRYGALRGVANAVLRNIAQGRADKAASDAALPALQADTVEAVAAALTQPAWWLRALGAQVGWAEAKACAEASNERPPLHLRVNPWHMARDALVLQIDRRANDGRARAEPVPGLPHAVTVAHAGAIAELPGYADGAFCVQDGAAQAVGLALGAPRGARVLDLCAAPGGKATHLLEQVGPEGRVVAIDIHPLRLCTAWANAKRLRLDGRLEALALDLTDAESGLRSLEAHGGPASHVLLDAPCSGMGTLRRHPELRRRQRDSLDSLLALQAALLDTAARMTLPGGVLVYAVCSPLDAEGPAQVAAFLARQPAFALEPLPPAARPWSAGPSSMCTWPHRHGLDGFFACRLLRTRP